MTDYNSWAAMGRIAKDPELRTTPTGQKVLNFTIANNKSFRAQGSEEWQSEALFMDCEIWGTYAESMAPKIAKGYSVFIDGRLRQDNWETEDGGKRSRIKCVVDFIRVTGKGKAAEDIPF
jgi:single-strand DNA-binding protein